MASRSSPIPILLLRVKEFLAGRLVLLLLALVILAGLAFLMRVPLMRATGEFLVREDAPRSCDAVYVLGGAAQERGEKGARLLLEGVTPVVWCTGSQVPRSLEQLGLAWTEAELSRRAAISIGADSSLVHALPIGTSTQEEAEGVIAHALAHGYGSIGVVSTEFHTRRVGRVFRKRAKGTGVKVRVFAAESEVYDREHWWASEQGLLMVNNEYVKLLYYWLKY